MLFWLTGVLAVVLILAFARYEVAMAERSERPVILLSCPDRLSGDTALAEPMCQAMAEALAAAAPGRLIQTVARGAERPQHPGDLGVALHVGKITRFGLTGYLEWWNGASGILRPVRGPTVEFDVMDAELTPDRFSAFTRGLLRATRELFAQDQAPE